MKDRKHDKLHKILKDSWKVKIDQGHKSALKHKMVELEACEKANDDLEYSGGEWTTSAERMKTMTIIRTDWRPVWAAVFILLAVVIILIPKERITSQSELKPTVLSASPYDVIIRDTAITSYEPPAYVKKLSDSGTTKLENRYVYMYDNLTYESLRQISPDEAEYQFRILGITGTIDSKSIKVLEVMVPENYKLESRDGNTIYYHVSDSDNRE